MKDYKLTDFEIGDIVSYSNYGGEVLRVFVEQKYEDVKKWQPGFAGFLVDGSDKKVSMNGKTIDVWGYCYQILSVEKENSNA
jgi:hypothetical protein